VKRLLELAERGLIPDLLVRLGIRELCRRRLMKEARREQNGQGKNLQNFLEELRYSPISVETRAANEQHYEVPPAFFAKVLGRRLKYSCCYFPPGVKTLDAAEEAMLALTASRAGGWP
jgi:cyclopropane-fatty-acyl-phospholipid synthase